MAKARTIYICQSCGTQAPKWLGKCPDCDAWNAFLESKEETKQTKQRRLVPEGSTALPRPLADVEPDESDYRPTGMPELDRVLGGGIVPGSLVMIGGDPGIGKSTIVLQALAKLSAAGQKTLYITGEESAAQVRMRAQRLGVEDLDKLFIYTENAVDTILSTMKALQPTVCVIDSIQTVYSRELTAAPGTVSQLREITSQFLYATKSSPMATILIGHVTKDGALAGPKVLEHMVDTVLYFEGERGHQYRLLRAFKNRFGSTNEVGVFEMTGTGLKEVPNPSAIFLAERPKDSAGSVVIVPLEGTRPLLVELQALVAHSGLGNPRRTVIGVESNRVNLLTAVLDKVVGLQLSDQDIYVNAAGGLKIAEPASDLGISLAIASSFQNRPMRHDTVVTGEVGLTGEVRAVAGLEMRLAEAAKLGFQQAIVPQSQLNINAPKRLELYGVKSVEQAVETIAS